MTRAESAAPASSYTALRPRHGARLAAVVTLLLLLLTPSHAQPYAAAGGFGRPVLEETRALAASVSVAVSPSGTVTTVWAGSEGVWRLDRTADGSTAPRLIAATDDVRSLGAAYVADELVINWITRDRSTGRYHYLASVGGVERELFQDSLIVDLELFDLQGAPFAAGLFRRGGEGQLRLLSLAGDDEFVVYRTPLNQRGLDVLPLPDGRVWLGWLEGRNERGEFGLISEWDAFVGLMPALGEQLVGPVALGAAFVEDERQSVALLAVAGQAASSDTVWALWSTEEQDLRLTQVVRAGQALSPTQESPPLGQGRPVGAAWPYLYWVSDSSVMRSGVLEQEPTSVAWSPVTMEGAFFATAPLNLDGRPTDLSAVAWYGRAQGGAIQIYSSDDRVPMELTLADRLAALMGWNPWHMWDELFGQLLTALLVGVLAATALVPILMLVGPMLGGLIATPAAAVTAGLVAGAVPLAVGAVIYARAFTASADQQLFWVAAALAAAGGLLLGWLIGRRGDRETHGTFTVVGAVAMFAAAAVFSFITYQQWAPLVGLS